MTYMYEIEHKEGGSSVDITVVAQNSEEAIEKAMVCHTNTGYFSIKRIHELFSYSDTPTNKAKE